MAVEISADLVWWVTLNFRVYNPDALGLLWSKTSLIFAIGLLDCDQPGRNMYKFLYKFYSVQVPVQVFFKEKQEQV